MGKGGCLGHTIALYDLDICFLLQLTSGIERQRRGSREDIFDRLHPTEIDRGVGKGQHDGWDCKVVRNTMLLAQLKRLKQVEAFHNDLCATTSQEPPC